MKNIIIVPAYNEAENIRGVLLSLRKERPQDDIVVVNDGSTDSTGEIARALDVVVIEHPFNLGIGATIQTGCRYAFRKGYDIAIQVDGDGQHPADQIKHILEPIERGEADITIGSRFNGGGYPHTWARWVGIKVFSKVISLILRKKFTDPTSGFRAVNREVIKFYSSNYPEDFPEVEAIVLLNIAGFTIKEITVRFEERRGGVSSITPLGGFYYMVKVLLAVFVDLLRRIKR